MKASFVLFALTLLGLSCQSVTEKNTNSNSQESIASSSTSLFHVDSIEAIFQNAQVTGTFVLKDLNRKETIIYNQARAKEYFLPASTFKIPNSLIALETKSIKDELEIIPWDGQQRPIENWNQDQSLPSAMKYSCVWFYQELARRIGTSRMEEYLHLMNYGNKDISAGIDLFWLVGNFKISALEQLDFIEKFYLESFPFANRNYKIVKDAILIEKNADYALRAKTGWAIPDDKPQIAWYVGYLEKGDNVYLFAMNLEPKNNQDVSYRQSITRKVFESANLIPKN